MSRRRRGMVVAWAWFLCGVAAVLGTSGAHGRDFTMLALPWLSFGGALFRNEDLLSSYTMLPIALKHFNDRNGTILPWLESLQCNATLSFVEDTMFDTEGLQSKALTILLDKLSENKQVDFVVGTARTDVVKAVAATAGALNLPVVTYLTTSEDVASIRMYPSLFKVIHSDIQYMELVVDLFVKFDFHVVGMIYSDDSFGTSTRDALASACEDRQIRLRSVSFNPSATGERAVEQMTRALRILAEDRINVIFRSTATNDYEWALAKAAVRGNMTRGMLYMFRAPSTAAELIDKAPTAQDKHTIMQFLHGSLEIAYSLTPSPTLERLVQAWQTTEPSFIHSYFPNGTTSLTGESFRFPIRSNAKLTMNQFRTYALAYDSIIAVGLSACEAVIARNDDLTDVLNDVQFDGVLGHFKFGLRHTPAKNLLGLALKNYVLETAPDGSERIRTEEVGTVLNGNWTALGSITFSDGSNTPPKDTTRRVAVVEHLPLIAKVCGWCEAGLAILGSLGAIVEALNLQRPLVHGHPRGGARTTMEEKGVVRTATLMFVGMSVTIMGISIAFLTVENEVGCMPYIWLFPVGLVLALSALLARSVHALVIRRNKESPDDVASLDSATAASSPRNGKVSSNGRCWGNRSLGNVQRLTLLAQYVLFVVVVLALAIGILTGWQIVGPYMYQIIVVQSDAENYPLYSVASCGVANQAATPFTVALISVIVALIITTIVVSFWANDGTTQEARLTSIAALSVFQVFFMGVPTAAAVSQTALSRFLVLSSMTFMLCVALLFTLFVSRKMRWHPKLLPFFPMRSDGRPNSDWHMDHRNNRRRRRNNNNNGSVGNRPVFDSSHHSEQSVEDPSELLYGTSMAPGSKKGVQQQEAPVPETLNKTSAGKTAVGSFEHQSSPLPASRNLDGMMFPRQHNATFDSLNSARKKVPAFAQPMFDSGNLVTPASPSFPNVAPARSGARVLNSVDVKASSLSSSSFFGTWQSSIWKSSLEEKEDDDDDDDGFHRARTTEWTAGMAMSTSSSSSHHNRSGALTSSSQGSEDVLDESSNPAGTSKLDSIALT